MKYLKQTLLILLISFIGELIKYFVPLPIPASIYGMVILFTCLMTGLIKLDQVKDAGMFLIEIMPVMFIPAGVGLFTSWGALEKMLLPVILVTIICIITVMIATGLVSQGIIRRSKSRANVTESHLPEVVTEEEDQ